VEEKVIEKAYKKLALDALVIQQGRLQENQKNVNKDDLLAMAGPRVWGLGFKI
jgi:SWI/SNF-related matrix-associated actin-dependent regulator of chromatin subfamily A member 5